jgi:peptide/nickel transport system substrate-binding protein
MKRPLYLIIVLATLAALLLNACGSAADSGPLVVLIDSDEGPLTPLSYRTPTGFWMTGWVYDTLYTRDLDFKPVPSLATAAAPSEDGLAWTIALRQDVKWHDGEPFTSADVLFTYQFLVQARRGDALAVIEKIEAHGDYAVVVTLRQPSPFFLTEGLTTAYILPAHIWRGQTPSDPQLRQFPATIGTGAYKLTQVVPGESYTFEANEDYFRGIPRVSQLIARIVSDPAEQVDQLRKRSAAASLTTMPPSVADDLSDIRRISLAEGSDSFSYVLYTNGSRTPFDQARIREAISLAINTQALVDEVLSGRGTALPASFYHYELPWAVGIPHLYDPEAAVALLDYAGMMDIDGDGIREWQGQNTDYAVLCNSDKPLEVETADLIVTWLNDVGIGAHAEYVDTGTQLARMWPSFAAIPDPDYDMAVFGWPGDSQSQESFLRYMLSDPKTMGWANLTGMVDPELQAILTGFLIEGDLTRQQELSTTIQEQFADKLPMIPLMAPAGTYAYLPEKYAGWQYMKGIGIAPFWSFLPAQTATP